MSIWWFAGPFLALAFVAIIAALSSGIPEAQRDDDLYLDADEFETPIFDGLAVEVFRRELDDQVRDGLADWGKGGVA